MAQQMIQNGCRQNRIPQRFAPFPEALVAGEHDMLPRSYRVLTPEEDIGCHAVEREISHFIDDLIGGRT